MQFKYSHIQIPAFTVFLAFIQFTFFLLPAEAREEIVLTIPKSGTFYLKKILGQFVEPVICSGTPYEYSILYNQFKFNSHVVVGHCEPLILDFISNNKKILLLIRDPRDVALSGIDFMDKWGIKFWPGSERFIETQDKWNQLTKIKKLSLILENNYGDRKSSVINFFETAMKLCSQNQCFIVKYEQLSPDYNDLTQIIQKIGNFFAIELHPEKALDIIHKSFKNTECPTLYKGDAFRYKKEDVKIVEFLTAKLGKYIDFFGFDRYTEEGLIQTNYDQELPELEPGQAVATQHEMEILRDCPRT